ncbi:U2 small nuclear ribonucleoprotein auxiliary factor 35 kDa subunit-related protein 1 isoform X3 [Bactrocera neohumeralis]|uniref:U2 small nuclear ribonucleoprotein auxiliary factor 35 kDa subunit-related protein 1 isoform X3 n=1 Tax=Bactrocera neohumeralis TaxID=98809 RepID=UPI002165BB54|nr:U2 small nuclear ribonucleoprotein auxiliary factor 35 kDa subunit-related protein 1 isoform X3 [Bactrocera neohumeralis]
MPGKRRPWRKELKKQQRKRKRRNAAITRDRLLEEEEAKKLKDCAYQQFLQQQALLEAQKLREIERLHDAEEEAWLRRDLLAHRQFRLQQQQRAAAEDAANAIRAQQEKELLAKLTEEQRRRDEREKREAAAAVEFEQMMRCMETFLNNGGEPPAELRRMVESRPGQKLCALYERTNCCRYGPSCINNHRRPLLSNVIVVRHFFMHPLLEEENEHQEYANADGNLELSEQDLCEAYNEFFEDVVPEFEVFGYIQNFRAIRNILRHLRGHVFVEYIEERSALKAFIKLQGRYYAGKQLNVEFANIQTWRSAICGLSNSRKCLNGNKCHYLHLFNNPDNKYNTPMVINRTPSIKAYMATPLLSWNAVTASDVKQSSRNWRWSESPEVEVSTATDALETNKTETSNTKRSSSSEFKDIDNMNVAQTSGKSHSDNNKKHKRKKHKHEREKAHKKHKRKRAHGSDSIDSEDEYRNKRQSKQKSEISKSSSWGLTYNDDSGKHRRSAHKEVMNKDKSRSRSKTRDKSSSKKEERKKSTIS